MEARKHKCNFMARGNCMLTGKPCSFRGEYWDCPEIKNYIDSKYGRKESCSFEQSKESGRIGSPFSEPPKCHS